MSAFNEFWSLYPRKEKKALAENRYKVIIKKYDQDKLYEMLNRFINDIQVRQMDKKYIPHCSTWLSQKRYLDFEEYEMQEVAPVPSVSEDSSNWYDDLKLG